MTNSFRSILENNSSIDSLWSYLDNLSKESIASNLDFQSYLVLADLYLDLGTEEDDSISRGLRWLAKYKRCPYYLNIGDEGNFADSYIWSSISDHITSEDDPHFLPISLVRFIDSGNYNLDIEIRSSITADVYSLDFKNSMISVALAADNFYNLISGSWY